MIRKRVLRPDRVRQVPPQFSWIDQRSVRDRYIEQCDNQALALYLLLVTVADAQGLSYYGDATICRLLSIQPQQLERARRNLVGVEFIALARTDREQPSARSQDVTPSRSVAGGHLRPPIGPVLPVETGAVYPLCERLRK